MVTTDTIAAIATAAGEAPIGVIRMSGPEALDIARCVFTPKNPPGEFSPQRLYYGAFKHGSTTLDNGYMVYMKAPNTYTGEDIVEFFLHGGGLILKTALEALLKQGARGAMPGEFTKRAFLNGKIDLTQAEAIIELIRAKSSVALDAARKRLEGKLSKKVNSIKDNLKGLAASIEAELDFPQEAGQDPAKGSREEPLEETMPRNMMETLKSAQGEILALVSTFAQGSALKHGVKVVIAGPPNAGKSSLLNILLKKERAIVTPIPGTTRDVIEETVVMEGIPIVLMDTAGLREGADFIEKKGVEMSRARIKEAELMLFVVDVSAPPFIEAAGLLYSILEGGGSPKIIIVGNKTDLFSGGKSQELFSGEIKTLFHAWPLVLISALKEEGIRELERKIFEEISGHAPSFAGEAAGMDGIIACVREKNALLSALEGIQRAREAVANNLPKEFIAEDIRFSITRLGEISGEVTTEDILDDIFGRFCIGK